MEWEISELELKTGELSELWGCKQSTPLSRHKHRSSILAENADKQRDSVSVSLLENGDLNMNININST